MQVIVASFRSNELGNLRTYTLYVILAIFISDTELRKEKEEEV